MKTKSPRHLATVALFWLLPLAVSSAAELRGRVTDSVTGNSLVGATVTLTPTVGAPVTDATDAFGRYEFTGLDPDTYTLAASHPGYTSFSASRTYAATDIENEDIPLTPDGTGSRLDILIQTMDTKAGKPLANVPVRLQRFDLNDDTVLEETITDTTDANGMLCLYGQRAGNYSFRFNSSSDGAKLIYYETYSVPGKFRIEQTHSAVAQLLPVSQSVTVNVKGIDPARPSEGEVGLKNVLVELTGVDPDIPLPPGFDPASDDVLDYAVQLLPPMTGVTDETGAVTFDDLPSISFVLNAKRLGYESPQAIIETEPSGKLPSSVMHTVTLAPTGLEVFLVHPAYDPFDFGLLPVKLTGIDGSNTEGIEFEVAADPLAPTFPDFPDGAWRAEFAPPLLLPGRYRIAVDTELASPVVIAADAVTTFGVRFRGGQIIDIAQGAVEAAVIELEVEPATIRGRLHVAEERATLAANVPFDVAAWSGPIYDTTAASGVLFDSNDINPVLNPGFDMVGTDADADGSFTVQILPGTYGVKIFGLDGYFGSNYTMKNLATGEEIALGWPYDHDPILYTTTGVPMHMFSSEGIPVSSGDDLDLDLFVRKQTYCVEGLVTVNSPYGGEILVRPNNDIDQAITVPFSPILGVSSGYSATLTGAGGPVETDFLAGTGTHLLRFKRGMGTKSLSMSHPLFTFTDGTSPLPMLLDFPDLGFVGEGANAGPFPLDKTPLAAVAIPPFSVPGVTANYIGGRTICAEFKGKDSLDMPVTRFVRHFADAHEHPDFDGRLFEGVSEMTGGRGDYDLYFFHAGDWYTTTVNPPAGSGDVDICFRLRSEWGLADGGPFGVPPQPTYTLRVRAVSDADPEFDVEGLTMDFDGTTTSLTTIDGWLSVPGFSSFFAPKNLGGAPSMFWLPTTGTAAVPGFEVDVNTTGPTPIVSVLIRMDRGMAVKGRVVHKDFPERGIVGASVAIRNRWGTLLETTSTIEGDLVTTADGDFELPSALPKAGVIFIEVDAPGYLPFRERFTPGDGSAGTTAGSTIDFDLTALADRIRLTPLPKPTFTSTPEASFNRKGPFLPGVSKSGAGVFAPDADVMMMYSVGVTPASVPVPLRKFDTPSGGIPSPSTETVTVTDKIQALWIIDPRRWVGTPYKPMAGDPIEIPFPVPTDALFTDDIREVLTNLQKQDGGGADPLWKDVSFVRNPSPAFMPSGPVTITGEIDLSGLPPGLFQPWVIVETQRGNYAAFQLKFTGTDSSKNLYGLDLPPWLSGFADVLGTVSAVQSGLSPVQMDKIFPKGLLQPIPEIGGDIEATPAGFLDYKYSIGVNLQEGGENSGGGLMALAPGFAGFDVNGEVEIAVKGAGPDPMKPGEPTISVSAEIVGTADVFDTEDLIPKSLPKATRKRLAEAVKKDLSVKVTAAGAAKIEALEERKLPHRIGDNLTALQRQMSFQTDGGVSGEIKANMGRLLGKVPYIGPVFLTLDETGLASVWAKVRPGMGATVTRTLSARFEREVPEDGLNSMDAGGGSVTTVNIQMPKAFEDDNALSRRRTFIGEELLPFTPSYDVEAGICFHYTTGVEVDIGNGTLGASADLAVTGNDCAIPALSGGKKLGALKVELNRLGDWPPIKRISGKLTASLEAFLDAWIVKVEKKWSWDLLEVDVPFNTEEKFFLIGLDVTESVDSPLTAPPVEWCGLAPHLIASYFSPTGFSVSPFGSGEILAFLDPDSAGGMMKLKIATRSGTGNGTWTAPIEIASATGIVEVVVGEIPGGGLMLVWSEVGSVGSFAPVSTLKFSTSADGVTWTAPATLGVLDGVGNRMRLFPMSGGRLGFACIDSERGPGSTSIDIEAAVFATGSWGPVLTLFDDLTVFDWDVEGPGSSGVGPAQIAVFTDIGGLVSAPWDGTTTGAPEVITDPADTAAFELVSDDGDTFIAGLARDDGIELFKKSSGGAWASLGEVIDGIPVSDFTLTHVAGTSAPSEFLLTYAEGGGDTKIGVLRIDEMGTVLAGPGFILDEASTTYSQLMALPGSVGDEGTLFALSDNNGEFELRAFEFDSTGALFTDRDADMMDDRAELLIVDFLTDDTLTKIDQILPLDDFDLDLFGNKVEIDAETNPTDPLSFPGQVVNIEVGTADCYEFGSVPGGFLLTRGGGWFCSIDRELYDLWNGDQWHGLRHAFGVGDLPGEHLCHECVGVTQWRCASRGR
ncbi:MAG: carboxypeptidase regulatory-like domain-containing protein [Verrucomicrobiota bacterium]